MSLKQFQQANGYIFDRVSLAIEIINLRGLGTFHAFNAFLYNPSNGEVKQLAAQDKEKIQQLLHEAAETDPALAVFAILDARRDLNEQWPPERQKEHAQTLIAKPILCDSTLLEAPRIQWHDFETERMGPDELQDVCIEPDNDNCAPA